MFKLTDHEKDRRSASTPSTMSAAIAKSAARSAANMMLAGRSRYPHRRRRYGGDRRLMVEHVVTNGILLAESDADQVLRHLANLWGYEVCLNEIDRDSGKTLKEHRSKPKSPDLG
jgi:hypothetical protein